MQIKFKLNGKVIQDDVAPDMMLLEYVRSQGCFSVKRGCETANCGLCTVLMGGKPVLSCSTLAVRADGKEVITLEGMRKEAEEFGKFLADEGAEQCGFCSPGFIMNVLAMEKSWMIRQKKKSNSIWREIYAAVPGIWGSCVRFKNICMGRR